MFLIKVFDCFANVRIDKCTTKDLMSFWTKVIIDGIEEFFRISFI